MNSNPLVSIIIPTYNRVHLIGVTLDSVSAQTYKNWECIIVDDGSSDGTYKLINEYIKNDNRFKYLINKRKKGAQGARNTGILNASTDWIVFFDSDDYMDVKFLEKLLLEVTTQKVDIVTCFSSIVNRISNKKQGVFNWVNKNNIHSDLLSGKAYVDYNGAIIKKAKLFEIGLLDEDCPSFQEWDTHIRLSKIGNYSTVEEYLVDYYVGGDDAISSDKKKTIEGYLYILNKHRKTWFSNEKISFYHYGNIVYKLIQEEEDKGFRNSKEQELFVIFPEIKIQLFNKKIKKTIKLFIPPIVFLIYNKLRGK